MEPVLFGLALGVGALYVAKRGRGAMHSAVGWTARKSGWLASRVRSSLAETRELARQQYERGRVEAIAQPTTAAVSVSSLHTDGSGSSSSTGSASPEPRAS